MRAENAITAIKGLLVGLDNCDLRYWALNRRCPDRR